MVLTEPNREALVRVLDLGTRLTKKLQGAGTGKQSVGGIENELDDLATGWERLRFRPEERFESGSNAFHPSGLSLPARACRTN